MGSLTRCVWVSSSADRALTACFWSARRARSTVIGAIAIVSTACASPKPAPQPPRPAPPPPVVVAEPPPPSGPEHHAIAPIDGRTAALLDSGELIVGHRGGLEAWRADGTGHRVISAGPALFPRRFGADYVVVLRPMSGPDVRDGAYVDLIALADGDRRPLAELPAFRCAELEAGHPTPTRLTVQEPADFEVDSSQGVACLGLMDGSTNSARVRVRARVDLRTQHVDRWLVVGEANCTPPSGVQSGDPAPDGVCWNIRPTTHNAPDPGAFPFTFAEEHVRMAAAPRGGAKSRLRGYQVEEPSPSGRWLLLAGDYSERDVVYRRLLLLDRRDGMLYPIPNLPGLWPSPLAHGSQLKTPIRQAQVFSSETDARWLGASPEAEVLVLDALVVLPGVRTFDIPEGTFAR